MRYSKYSRFFWKRTILNFQRATAILTSKLFQMFLLAKVPCNTLQKDVSQFCSTEVFSRHQVLHFSYFINSRIYQVAPKDCIYKRQSNSMYTFHRKKLAACFKRCHHTARQKSFTAQSELYFESQASYCKQ